MKQIMDLTDLSVVQANIEALLNVFSLPFGRSTQDACHARSLHAEDRGDQDLAQEPTEEQAMMKLAAALPQ